MMKNITLLEKDKCCGCSACFNICPTKAISMIENEEGFKYPVIDEEKCTNCGLCARICPVLNPIYKNNLKPKSYAVMASDEIRQDSSSGGVFPIIASYFFYNEGYVAGAVWGKGGSVKHIVSNKKDDIAAMRGSKYLQSEIGDCYKEVKQILDNNKKVLFTGTPCQIAGLYAFLQKEYENLFTLEIICHGTPSPKVFKKYLDENLEGEEFVKTNFRDKIFGWKPSITTTTTTTTTIRKIIKPACEDDFMQAFLKNLCLRKSCGKCKFNKIPRQADITMGDFWGVWKFNKKLDDRKGTSIIFINNKKGLSLFNKTKKDFKLIKQVPFKKAIKGNKNVIQSSVLNPAQKIFYEALKTKTLKQTIDILVSNKCDYLIVNFWDSKFNYGALLTAYALQEIIKSFNLIPRLLNTGERTNSFWFKNSHMEDFTKKFLNITKELSFEDCQKFSKNIKGIILGSDQVLRIDYMGTFLNKFMLSFASKDIKKIAFAPSFGLFEEEYYQKFQNKAEEINYMKKCLKTFDYLSTREFEGQKIYKNLFDLDSDLIIDPVFIIDKQKYITLADNSELKFKNNIVSYVLDKDENYQKAYEYLKTKTGLNLFEINRTDNTFSTEDWINAIINSELIISDSFHCICFAIIFNKSFICIKNKNRGSARLDTLCKLFNIEKYIISSPIDIMHLDNIPKIDYTVINEKIIEEKYRCLNILKNILFNNYSNNQNKTVIEECFKLNKKQKNKIKNKCLKYKILSKITFGKLKKRYKNKYKLLQIKKVWN